MRTGQLFDAVLRRVRRARIRFVVCARTLSATIPIGNLPVTYLFDGLCVLVSAVSKLLNSDWLVRGTSFLQRVSSQMKNCCCGHVRRRHVGRFDIVSKSLTVTLFVAFVGAYSMPVSSSVSPFVS